MTVITWRMMDELLGVVRYSVGRMRMLYRVERAIDDPVAKIFLEIENGITALQAVINKRLAEEATR